MKIFCLIFVIFAVTSTFAQQAGDKTLVDEFGALSCDDFLARVDNFFIQIHNRPEARGYYVVSGNAASLGEKLIREQEFRAAAVGRRYSLDAITIVRAEDSGPIKMQMWLAPKSVEYPEFQPLAKAPTLISRKPLLLRTDSSEVCPLRPLQPVTRELLEANPEWSIYVIIHVETRSKRKHELKNAMSEVSSFPAARVRYVYSFTRPRYGSDYWLARNGKSASEARRW